jgi:nucleoside-diphosphate-sugar epimerase
MSERPKLLITGGSGLLGSAVVDRLRPLDPVCLTRSAPVDRARTVAGDLRDDRLGLTREDRRRLIAQTDVIIHCAALTGFGISADDAMAVNRDGTRNLLRLAEQSGAKFVYVSSAFVARRHHAPVPQHEGEPSPRHYLDSKQAAEDLVAGSDVPSVVVRPSVVIGNSRTGEVRHQQGFHSVLEALCKGTAPIIPFAAEAAIDFLPQDVVAEAIAEISLEPAAAGEYWLTAGPEAVTAEDVVSACCRVMRERNCEPGRPRFGTPEMIDRLIMPAFASALPTGLTTKFTQMLAMGRLFGADRERFPTSLGSRTLVGQTPIRQRLLEALDATIRYSWGSPVAPVLEDAAV